MTTRRIGIPSVPPGFTPEQNTFFQSIKQNVERLDTLTTEQQTELDKTIQYSTGGAPDLLIITSGVLTPTARNGGFQKYVNNGAHTLQPPTENCMLTLLIKNGASAGAITITGFSKVVGTAAPPSNSTTSGHEFFARITVIDGFSLLEWNALQ